jgi:GTP-binding protein
MSYAPIAFITGQTGKNVKALLNHSQMLFKQSQTKVPTPALNRLIQAATRKHEPPLFRNKRPRIYYATQITAPPPTIIAMCNMSEGFSPSYRRYLLGILRDYLPFGEVPIKFYFQQRQSGLDTTRKAASKTGAEEELADQESWEDEDNTSTTDEQYEELYDEDEGDFDDSDEDYSEEFDDELGEDELIEIEGYDEHPDAPSQNKAKPVEGTATDEQLMDDNDSGERNN